MPRRYHRSVEILGKKVYKLRKRKNKSFSSSLRGKMDINACEIKKKHKF